MTLIQWLTGSKLWAVWYLWPCESTLTKCFSGGWNINSAFRPNLARKWDNNIYNLYFATYQISNGGYAGACHGTKAYHQAVVQQNFIALSVIELLVFYLSVYMDGGFEKLNIVLIIRNFWSIRSIHNLSPNCGAQTWSLIQPHTGSFESARKFQSDRPRLNSENTHQVLRCRL